MPSTGRSPTRARDSSEGDSRVAPPDSPSTHFPVSTLSVVGHGLSPCSRVCNSHVCFLASEVPFCSLLSLFHRS